MTSENSKAKAPHITREHALNDLRFTNAETLEIRVKAQIYHDLLKFIRSSKLTQQQLVSMLDLHQPDVSNLLNGRISKFSMSKLIQIAGKLDLHAQIRLVKPRRSNAGDTSASNSVLRRAAKAA